MRPLSMSMETIKQMRAETGSYAEIAEKYGKSVMTVMRVMRNEIYHDPKYVPEPRRPGRNNVSAEQVEMIRSSNKTIKELVVETGLSTQSIMAIRTNRSYHKPTYEHKDRRKKLRPEQIKKLLNSDKPQTYFAELFGVTQPTISYYRRKFASAV